MTPKQRSSGRHQGVLLALALWALWTFSTWLLEGRLGTLLRPEAQVDRAVYALVANLGIGLVGGLLCFAGLARQRLVSPRRAGFPGLKRTLLSVVVAMILGASIALGALPSLPVVVLLNGFAQVLVVSLAEVAVCWLLLGGTVRSALADRSRWSSGLIAAGAASVAFGVYHVAHSPPFNTAPMLLLLTGVGLLTSGFFFLSRDVSGTVLFHNWLGTLGVLRSLDESSRLAAFAQPRLPILAMALLGLLLLLAADVWLTVTPRAHAAPPASPTAS